MNGFVQEAEREKEGMSETVMNGYMSGLVPVYETLVREFAVCHHRFASVLSSMQPNRLYVHSATSHGLTSNDTKKLVDGLPQKAIFDSLHEAGYSFDIYYQYPPATLFYSCIAPLSLPFFSFSECFRSITESALDIYRCRLAYNTAALFVIILTVLLLGPAIVGATAAATLIFHHPIREAQSGLGGGG